MLYQRKGTKLFYNVTNPNLIPLYEDNEMYEKVEEVKEEAPKAKPKATKKK